MNAHRQIIKPVGRFINIELPKEFLANDIVISRNGKVVRLKASEL